MVSCLNCRYASLQGKCNYTACVFSNTNDCIPVNWIKDKITEMKDGLEAMEKDDEDFVRVLDDIGSYNYLLLNWGFERPTHMYSCQNCIHRRGQMDCYLNHNPSTSYFACSDWDKNDL